MNGSLSRANCFKLAQCLHTLSRINESCMHCKKPQKLIHMSMKIKWEFISSVSVNFHSFSLIQKHSKCRQCCNVHSLLEVLFACFCRAVTHYSAHIIGDANTFHFVNFHPRTLRLPQPHTPPQSVWQIVERRRQQQTILLFGEKSMNGTNWFIDSDTQQQQQHRQSK